MSSRHSPWFASLAALAVLAGGCAVSGLSFVQDERVHIQAPGANATVEVPFEIRWTAEDFDGRFVVLLDRTPMRPGQTLQSLVPSGDPCRAQPTCPDVAWLAERDIYVTDSTSLRIERLPDRRTTNRARDRHDLIIVLLDESGRRAGESVFTSEFVVDREP